MARSREVSVDVSDLDDADPRRLFLKLEKLIRPSVTHPFNDAEKSRVRTYYQKLRVIARRLNLDLQIDIFSGEIPADQYDPLYEHILSQVEGVEVDVLIDDVLSQNSVKLDNAWRQKIHTYVEHIRDLISAAQGLPDSIRESLLQKLHAFDAEVDRGRTRVQAFTEVLVGLCEGISAGATALAPAVRLGERIVGALARLGKEPPVLALPPPEQFDLPPPASLHPPTISSDEGDEGA